MWHPDLDPYLSELVNPHRQKIAPVGITYIRPVAVPAVHNAVQQLLLLPCTHFSHQTRDPGWVKNIDPDPGQTFRIIFPRA